MLKNLQKNVLLKNYTTFKIGGKAKYFLKIKTNEKLIQAIKWAKKRNLPFFILGGGSNLLVADKGYKGLVINFQLSNTTLQEVSLFARLNNTRLNNFQKNEIIVGAGMKLGELINISANKKLTGLEWAAGIPGTIGGAIRGNIEAFGWSIGQFIKKVEVYDVKKEKIKNFNNQDCKFSYKNSVFKKNPNLIILSAEIKLKKNDKKKIKKKICDNLAYRAKNHPLNFPSAGCIFKNYIYPVNADANSNANPFARKKELLKKSQITNNELAKQFPEQFPKQFPEFKEFNKKKLIPAGWLIEKCGLKGKRVGGAEVSQKHANFIISAPSKFAKKTKAKDVVNLIKLIKKKVKEKFKIKLEEEIQYLGF